MPAIMQGRKFPTPRDADPVSGALEQLFQRYTAIVRQVALRHNLAEADVDEVIQDVRIRIWRALSTGEKIAQAPASYVYRAACSAALDLIRRRRARFCELARQEVRLCSTVTPEEVLEEHELAENLERAAASLVRPRRVVVRMHLRGYHRHEIAEILGWSEAKTRNLLYRGLADVRARLHSTKGNGGGVRRAGS